MHLSHTLHFIFRALDNLILQIGRLFTDMTFNVTRPNGTKLNALVEVTLDRVLKAVLIFKGLMIEWVVVKGFAEESVSTDGGVVDVWSDSRYKVFRKITENANAAMLNFASPVYPEVAVKSFMVRFAIDISFSSLCELFCLLSDLPAQFCQPLHGQVQEVRLPPPQLPPADMERL